ncbi:MAG: PD-(D/E)XK nuclease family protein, partial [Bacteroidetes bacterium]
PTLPIVIPATEETRARLLARFGEAESQGGLSASTLNTYRACSLQFYFRYIAGLKEADEVEESIAGATFGQVIHLTLEKLYRPFLGKTLTEDHFRIMEGRYPQVLEEALAELGVAEDTLARGKNLLLKEAILALGGRFFREEARGGAYRLEDLENHTDYWASLQVGSYRLRLRGTFDRIDAHPDGAWTRIVDYKTGSLDIRNPSIEDLMQAGHTHKEVFQGYVYAWLFRQRYPGQAVQVAFYPFRELGKGMNYLGPKDNPNLAPEVIDQFGEALSQLLSRLLHEDYVQTDELKICAYCPYRRICSR